jgi:hypothetical protein
VNEQAGAIRIAGPADPLTRQRRMEALQRAHRARRILDQEAELAARYGDRLQEGGSGRDAETDRVDGTSGGRARSKAYEDDVERLLEIHRNLRHERHVARRPFHRHSERLVLALELAERLALERLGFDDFADFEAHQGDGRPGREIVDVDLVEWAQRELSEAQAILAELGGVTANEHDAIRLPAWTVDPILQAHRQRATRARREVFGAGRPSLFDRPPLTDDDVAPVRPLPLRKRSRGGAVRAADRDHRTPAPGDEILGEIVHNGRTLRVEKIGGLVYSDDEDGSDGGGITYGDPNRPG